MSVNPSQVLKRKNVVLHPQNGQTFSVNNGTNIIRLQVANSREVMKNGSLHLNADLQVHDANGDNILISQDTKFNCWSGAQSCIESVNIYSLKHNSLLENIKNYGRYVAKRIGVLHGLEKVKAGLWNECLCASNYETTRIASQTDSSISLEIMSGLLHNTERFSMEDIGGLVIEVQLSSSPQFIFDEDGNSDDTYSLSNVKFNCVMYEPNASWFEAKEASKNNGVLLVPYDSTDSRLNQLVSNNDSINDIVNFRSLKSVSFTMLTATDQNNMNSDSFEQQSKGWTEMSMSVNGLKNPYKFSIKADANTNKSMFARSYLEAVSHSNRPEYDGVRTNLDPSNYADTSASVQLSGLGYLLSESGVGMRNSNINVNVISDINAQTVCFMEYDHEKTLIISPQVVTVSS